MGNLDAERDWGHARDYVEMQWRLLQQDHPEDFVIATWCQESVRRFIELAAEKIGWGGITWEIVRSRRLAAVPTAVPWWCGSTPDISVSLKLRPFREMPPRRGRKWAGPPIQRWSSRWLRWWRSTTKRPARKRCSSGKISTLWGRANDPDLWIRPDRHFWCSRDGGQCHGPGLAAARLWITADVMP